MKTYSLSPVQLYRLYTCIELNSDDINIIFSGNLNKECPVPVHHQVDESEGVRGELEVKRLMKLVVARHISKNPTLPWILLCQDCTHESLVSL